MSLCTAGGGKGYNKNLWAAIDSSDRRVGTIERCERDANGSVCMRKDELIMWVGLRTSGGFSRATRKHNWTPP